VRSAKPILAAVLAALGVACAAGDGDVNDSAGAVVSAPTKGPLSPVDEDGLYHWTEGSQFLPYFAVRAMKVLHDLIEFLKGFGAGQSRPTVIGLN
jgi:hypothetical protein